MTFSMQLQLSYLWLHRHLELDPAQALLSPLAYEGDMWLSIGGCVGFLTEEQDAKNFSSAVLLSEHSVLAKDHRKLLLRLEGGADDREYLGLVLRTIGGSEITFLPSSLDQWKRWIARLQMSGVKVSDSLDEELKGIKRVGSCTSVSINTSFGSSTRDIMRKFQNMEKEAVTLERSSHLTPPQFMKKSITISHLSLAAQPTATKQRMTQAQIRTLWREAARKALHTPEAARARGRMQAIRSLIKTECAYVRTLHTLVHHYKEPLSVAQASGVVNISADLINSLFLNCETLLSLHQTFLMALTQACSSANPCLSGIFQVVLPQLHSYADFITLKRRHARQLTPLQECLQNQSFSDFLCEWHRSHDGEGKQLKRLLLRPQERLYEYAKALEHITSSTDKFHSDYEPLKACHDQLRTLTARLNTDQSPRELHDKICHIIRGVGSSAASLLTGPSTIIKEEVISTVKVPLVSSLKSIKYKTIILYLFDTALVVWVKESKHSHSFFPLYGATVYEHVTLEGKVFSSPTPDCSHRSFKLYSPGGPRQGVVLSFKHITERTTWLTIIKKAIADAQPKCAPSSRDTSHSPKSRLRRSLSTYSLNSVFVQSGRHNTPVTTPVTVRKLERNASIMSVSSVSSTASMTSTSTSSLMHKSYTVTELFNFLVDPPSTDYVKTFLLTYHLFTNATEVMDALIEAHQHWLSSPQGTEGHTPVAQRLRCLNAFKIWVNKFYTDFRHDGTLKQKLSSYLGEALQDPSTFEGEKEQMKRIIDVIHKSETVLTMQRNKLRAPMFSGEDTPTLKFVEISAERIANQITVIEHEVLQRIKPFELVGQKWTKRNKRDIAPGICCFIERFNLTTRWVVREVLTPQLPRQRAIMIEKFIRIAETCMEWKNFNTVFEVTLALQSAPVRRLHQTWQEVSQEAMLLLSNFKQFINPKNSFSALKEQIRKCSTPAVPYIGAFLSQLVTLEEGMATFLEDEPDHINFTKLHKMAGLIEEITRLQMPPYAIEADQSVIQYLSDAFDTLSQFGEDEQDLLSAEREPRAGSVGGTPLVNHRVISVMSSGSRSSESLSQRSSEDFSLLGSCEEISTSIGSEMVDREQRDRQDSGVIDTAV